MTAQLCFRPDGTFTIAQFTDLHWANSDEVDARSRALMARVIETERPDLIIFTGDVISDYLCRDPIQSFRDAVSVADESGVPWAMTFGNHDTEVAVTKSDLMDVVLQFETSVQQRGSSDITGVGNCVLEILGGENKVKALLYLLDSGLLSNSPQVDGYDWIHHDQVAWYVQQSSKYTDGNGGEPLPSLAFFHIPLPEYQTVWDNGGCHGNKLEGVCAPKINSGLFAAMVEMRDVMGTFVGHDHTNDYCGTLHGIQLCYGRATGYNGYGREDFNRGSRIIQLREGAWQFQSWIRLDDGSKVQVLPDRSAEEIQ